MSKLNYSRGCVYCLEYHIVWCVKYRKRIINKKIEIKLKEILLSIANENEIKILEMEANKDHIHLLIEGNPKHSLITIIKVLKGKSARYMFLEFPRTKK